MLSGGSFFMFFFGGGGRGGRGKPFLLWELQKFVSQNILWFNLILCSLICSPACSRYVTFVELVYLNDLLGDVPFLFLTNQTPAKIYHTRTHSRTYSQTPLLEPPALQAMPGLIRSKHLLFKAAAAYYTTAVCEHCYQSMHENDLKKIWKKEKNTPMWSKIVN